MTNPGRLVIGAALIAGGLVYLMDAAGWIDAGDVASRWWPLVLIAIGGTQLLADRGNWLGPAVLIVLGLIILGQRNDVLPDDVWTYVWPLGLVALGVWFLIGRGGVPSRVGDGSLGFVAVLTSRDVVVAGEPFRGGDATVVLGSATIDLTEADIGEGATITGTIVLGSLTVLVPPGWRIVLSGTPLLSGWDDTTRRDAISEDAPRLEVRTLIVLGGVEVRHPERWAS